MIFKMLSTSTQCRLEQRLRRERTEREELEFLRDVESATGVSLSVISSDKKQSRENEKKRKTTTARSREKSEFKISWETPGNICM